MNKPDPARGIAVNGVDQPRPIGLPFAVNPDAAKLDGTKLTNTGTVPLWMTVTITGTPKEAPEPITDGFAVRVSTVTLDGTPYDPATGRQNDRFMVVIEGESQDRNLHHCVLTQLLPAGWEIESVVRGREEENDSDAPDPQAGPSFLGETSQTSAVALKDDRFFAAFDLRGGTYRPASPRILGSNAFRLAYIVRAVTPGQFLMPETVVRDRFSPALMGRNAAGRIVIAPR